MGFDFQSSSTPPPPRTTVQGNLHGFRGVLCIGQKYNFMKVVPLPFWGWYSFWNCGNFGTIQ